MTPQQALDFLDSLVKRVTATREDHLRIQQAVAILRTATTPAEVDSPQPVVSDNTDTSV